jgi:hypothetical protein
LRQANSFWDFDPSESQGISRYPLSCERLSLCRGLCTSEAEELLYCNLVNVVGGSAEILSGIIDFRSYQGKREADERPFPLCTNDFRVHDGSSASQVMRALDVTRLSDEDMGRLCALEQLNWGVLNLLLGT